MIENMPPSTSSSSSGPIYSGADSVCGSLQPEALKNIDPDSLHNKTGEKRKTIIDEVEKVEISLKRVKIAAIDMERLDIAQAHHYSEICDKLSDYDATKKTVEQLAIDKTNISKELDYSKKMLEEKEEELKTTILEKELSKACIEEKCEIEKKVKELENELTIATNKLEEQKLSLQAQAEEQNKNLRIDLANALADVDRCKISRDALDKANEQIEEMDSNNKKWKDSLLTAIQEKFEEKDRQIEEIQKHWKKAREYFQLPDPKSKVIDDDNSSSSSHIDSVSMTSKKSGKSSSSCCSKFTYYESDYSRLSKDPHQYDEMSRKIHRCTSAGTEWLQWLKDENKTKHQLLMDWLASPQQQLNFTEDSTQACNFFKKYTSRKASGIRYQIHNLVADFIYSEFKITMASEEECKKFPNTTIHHKEQKLKMYIRYLQNYMLKKTKEDRYLSDLHNKAKQN